MSGAEERIAALAGLAASFRDQTGATIETSPETRRAVLAALGLDVSSDRAAASTLRMLEHERRSTLPPTIVVDAERATTIQHSSLSRVSKSLSIRLEDGGELVAHAQEARLTIPPLPVGYHALAPSAAGACFIFSAPPRCWSPPAVEAGARLWGVAAQVYSLRRAADFGMGDLGHVRALAEGCARHGASFLGLSPLHSLFPHDPTKVSPYSPSTRLFIDPLYIDPARAALLSGAQPLSTTRQGEDHANGQRLVDYAAVWRTKEPLLRAIWDERGSVLRADPAFRAFVVAHSDRLQRHARFESLSAHFAQEGLGWSGAWPQQFADPDGTAVAEFSAANADIILFRCWLQYMADTQLAETAHAARGSGMDIGLYRDLAVGADLFGSERWSDPQAWCSDLSIGAPPDPLGPKGQDWGLPPLDPMAQRRSGLAMFRALVGANMRHAGALRIDHAFQLQRLFVIPRGRMAREGAYLDYPFDEMLAVLRIESHRAKCAVVGEDLGNGPDGFSARIMGEGIFSYRILGFERTENGSLRRPDDYPDHALASINTHDLPTFAGWWRGLDIDLRECFGVYDRVEWKREQLARNQEKSDFLASLEREDLAPHELENEPDARRATVRYLARTKAALATVSLEDVDGEISQPNLPGLVGGYPNWRRRLDAPVDVLTEYSGPLARIASLFARERRGLCPSRHALAAPAPQATYRLQLHAAFTFEDACAVLPQLAALGVSHVYVSPIVTAHAGSMHGYDVIDPKRINPELGGEEGFLRFSEALKCNHLSLIVDIVPNHMGIGAENAWWLSVMEWGRASPFAHVFDIRWDQRTDGKLLLPILGEPFEDALRAGKFTLRFDKSDGRFWIDYFETRLPVFPGSYGDLLRGAAMRCPQAEAKSLETLAGEFDHAASAGAIGEAPEHVERLRAKIADLAGTRPAIADALRATVAESTGSELARLIEGQHWRAAWWRSARADINYRRFFEIDALAGLRIEDPRVFEETHERLFSLADAGRIQGFRVDHIDGLADPGGYLEKLQSRAGPGFYVVVEKILEGEEQLPPWPVAGTTGYDALAALDAVFVDENARPELDRIADAAADGKPSTAQMLASIKSEICESDFPAELGRVTQSARAAIGSEGRWADLSDENLRRAIVAFIAHLPRYRTYLQDGAPGDADARVIAATGEAMRADAGLDPLAVDGLLHLLTFGAAAPARSQALVAFRTQLQQLSGPVMAKGLEDTFFYRRNRLIALNEVGANPFGFGLSINAFHAANLRRLTKSPASLVATSTHDTKRGEDARARIIALGARPADIEDLARLFLDDARRGTGEDIARRDALMLTQAIVGAWPLQGGDREDLLPRLQAYAVKALREAKLRSSWLAPNEEYEESVSRALERALAPGSGFSTGVHPVLARVDVQGMWIALGRTVLKCLGPGVPDLYQGCEVWNQSLVDPDNRRPAPYDIPAASEGELPDLLQVWRDGKVKRELTRRLLALRATERGMFPFGVYEPMDCGDAWIAFRRGEGCKGLSIFVRRFFDPDWRGPALPTEAFEDLVHQVDASSEINLLRSAALQGTSHDIASLFAGLPIAVLRKK